MLKKNALIALPFLIALAVISVFALRATAQSTSSSLLSGDSEVSEDNEKVFDAEIFRLENGLQIAVIPNHRTPVVTHMVWYKAGAAEEPQGTSGIAHFLEHLMFRGSAVIEGEDLKPGEFSKIVRKLGGNDNAFTGQDYTAYFQSVPVEHLETVMRMEAGRMQGLKLTEETIETERKVILEERRQRIESDPFALLDEQISAALFVNHPYGTPVIGWMHEMEALSLKDARTFYDRWYRPDNAILVVSGDVTGARVRDLAEKIYGPIPSGSVPPRQRTHSPFLGAEAHFTLRHPHVHQPMVLISFRAPGVRENPEDSLALEILQDILGGGPTSRLYRALVNDQKIASVAELVYRPYTWDDAELSVYASPLPGVKPERVEASLRAEIRNVIESGVTETELKDSIARLQSAAIYARDSLAGPAMTFGQALATGASAEHVEYWPRNIAKITVSRVQGAAAKYLGGQSPVGRPPITAYLLPEEDKP